MMLSECIIILANHNNWRRGLEGYQPTEPNVLGAALDYAISTLTAMSTMQDMHETMMPKGLEK
jgi:hypothetical protein